MQLPKLEVIDASRKEFRLLDDWQLDYQDNTIIIPTGFITDLASVPSPFFWWQWGAWNLPAIIHDWAYLNHFLLFLNADKSLTIFDLTRAEADLLFYQLLEVFQVPFLVRQAMYLAVRVGGRKHWC
jgi:hypothetical protein